MSDRRRARPAGEAALRRVVRILLWTVPGALLAACLATLGLWVRSGWVEDGVAGLRELRSGDDSRPETLALSSARGDLTLCRLRLGYPPSLGPEEPRGPYTWHVASQDAWPGGMRASADRGWGPLRWGRADHILSNFPTVGWFVVVPHWAVAGVLGAWPLAWLAGIARRRVLRRRRARAGRCRGCAYDLRATPDGGGALLAICPECGRAR
jgi:hypothetical protein